jgi:MoaA/NifB/PqqE/SkfB family radical SAM enzyme
MGNADRETIPVVSLPGLSVRLRADGGVAPKGNFPQLEAKGKLSAVCKPFLKRINDRLREEKPALVREDSLIASTWLPPIPGGPFKRLVMAEVQASLGRRIPETVSFEITRECGCKCDHCFMSEGEGELETPLLRQAMDDAVEMGAVVLVFTEGDPMLRPDIFELISHVDPEKAVVNMYTPGTEMTPEKARKLKEAGLHNLLVSIYSTDPAKHDAIRRLDGAHRMALDAMKMGLEAGLLVTMCTHTSPASIHELPGLYELAKKTGVHEFSIWEGVPKKQGDPVLDDSQREQILEMYHRINTDPGGPRIFANSYFEGEMLGCMAGERWMHVCVDGDVKPCPYMPFSFGSVREKSLKEIWKGMKVLTHPRQGTGFCAMQHPHYLDLAARIPEDSPIPYPFDMIK